MADQALQEKIVQAAVLGTIAFKAGKTCVPAHDKDLMQLLKGLPVGGGLPILKAWSESWHAANLSKALP